MIEYSLFRSTEKIGEERYPVVPVAAKERIVALDIVRGIAIFGILPVNMLGFGMPPYVLAYKLDWWNGRLDQITLSIITFFLIGKFYSMFSFLFGLGLAVQMERTASEKFLSIYGRRLIILFIIGISHALFIWWGDILHLYALLGLFLLLFRNSSHKNLVMVAIISLAIPIQLSLIETVVSAINSQDSTKIKLEAEEQVQKYKRDTFESIRIYSKGSFKEILKQRINDLEFQYAHLISIAPHIFAMFLMGLYIGKKKIIERISDSLVYIRKGGFYGLLIGIIGNTIFLIMQYSSNPFIPSWNGFIEGLSYIVGAPSLCFFYISIILLLVEKRKWNKILLSISSVGRMALSNYLFHSIICTTIFYSYGFGLYGKIGPAKGFILTILIYLIQLYLSSLWLKRFQFGPIEWIWKSMAYGRFQKMRV